MPAATPFPTRHRRHAGDIRLPLLVALVAGIGASLATVAVVRIGDAPPPAAPVATPVPAPASAPADADAELTALRDALADAEAERSQLAATVVALDRRNAALETRLGDLSTRVEAIASAPAATFDDGSAFLPSGEVGGVIVAGDDSANAEPDGDDATGRGPLDSLVAAGLDPQSAQAVLRRRDEFQLARLELVDRATREGWREDRERFGDSLEALEESRPDLREELGEAGYDRYLYAEGGDNRVGVASVIDGSAASLAGLEPGDVIVSYAGERVFGTRELQSATRGGELGEYVQMGVKRGDGTLVIDVPRGPLGVTLSGRRVPPGG